MPPRLSIIIPVYNAEKYLAECLDSICSQTVRDIEIICVNDGSTDRSPDILENYAQRDSRIRVITQENAGEVAARSTGIDAAGGQWFGFTDSDDIVEPDMFERLLNNAEKYHADISHCGVLFFYPDGRRIPHYNSGMLKMQDHDTALLDLLDGSQIEPGMWNKIYKADLFQGIHLTAPVRHNGDLVCNFELFERARSAVYEDFCGYRYRKHSGAVSADWKSVNTLKTVLKVRRDLLEKSTGAIRSGAYRYWLSTLVHSLNLLSVSDEEEAPMCYEECRKLLRNEEEGLSCLSMKQRIAAWLHLINPALARLVYLPYGKISQYRYEH